MSQKKDPGLGSIYEKEVKRLVNEDGSYNIKRHGALKGFRDFYKFLIDISWLKFILLTFAYYIILNIVFACLYLISGVDGITSFSEEHNEFLNAFFFSVQTLTSVGYGQLSPISMDINVIATIESFAGVMSIAFVTGLTYGRFSKPRAKLGFSKNILITPYKGVNRLMFKMVNKRDSILLNAHVKAILILDKGGDDNQFNKEYFILDLELNHIHFFPLTWTIVHKIDDDSPIHGMSIEELMIRNAEVLVLVEAFDETHSQNITQKHAYGGEDWLNDVKFKRNFKVNLEGTIELKIKELDEVSGL